MKRVISIILVILMIIPSFSLFGCKKDEKRVLRISNCEDYISTGDDEYVDLLAKFTEETGIEVEYSTYSTNENLYNELAINPKSYDVVMPSEYMIQKLATEGRLQKIDLSKVENYEYVSPYIKNVFDGIEFEVESGEYKGETLNLNDFSIGYMWGTMGWVYNVDTVDIEDVKTWNSVFTSGNYDKRMTLKDSVRDSYLIGLGMVYEDELTVVIEDETTTAEQKNAKVNEIFNRTSEDAINAVGDKLTSYKDKLYGFEVDSGKADVVNGKIDAYVAWSGDAAYAIDEALEDETYLDYYIPDCGSNIWFDGMVIPAESKNADLAHEFINFICDPENAVENMNYIGYSSVVAGETIFEGYMVEYFDESEDLAEDEGIEIDLNYFFKLGEEDTYDYTIKVSEESYGRVLAQYPMESDVVRCAVMSYFDSDETILINNMWEKVKGSTFDVGLIIGVVILVVFLAVVIVLFRFRDKIKWFKLPEFRRKTLKDKGYKVISKEEIY